MRKLLLIIFLSGCTTVQDNTTLGDKAVIGSFATIMIVASKAMGL